MMRMIAGVFVISGLAALSISALAQHDVMIVVPSIALAALWSLAIALRWPRPIHTGCLALAAVLCALSTFTGLPVLVSVFCLSVTLYGWDLALMELRLSTYPLAATSRPRRKYLARCLGFAVLGFGAALLARVVRFQISFFSAFAASCLCLVLFLVIHRQVRTVMADKPTENEERAAEPPA